MVFRKIKSLLSSPEPKVCFTWHWTTDLSIGCNSCGYQLNYLAIGAFGDPKAPRLDYENIYDTLQDIPKVYRKAIGWLIPLGRVCKKCKTSYIMKNKDQVVRLEVDAKQKCVSGGSFSLPLWKEYLISNTQDKKFVDLKKCECKGKLVSIYECPDCGEATACNPPAAGGLLFASPDYQ